jgi:hypothetical protein
MTAKVAAQRSTLNLAKSEARIAGRVKLLVHVIAILVQILVENYH